MIVVVGGRGTGKTVASVRWLMEDPMGRLLIVANGSRKQHLLSVLREETLKYLLKGLGEDFWSKRIYVIEPYMRGMARGLPVDEIGIDDLEDVLWTLFRGRVEFASCNGALFPLQFIKQAQEPQLPPLSEQVRYRPPRIQ